MKDFDIRNGSGYIIYKDNNRLFCRELISLYQDFTLSYSTIPVFTAHFGLRNEYLGAKSISTLVYYVNGNEYLQNLTTEIQNKEQQLKNIELKIEEETKRLNNIQNANCSLMIALEKMTNEAKSELENVNNRIERMRYDGDY